MHLLCLLIALAWPVDEVDDATKKDQKSFQGVWKVVKVEDDPSRVIPDKLLKDFRFVIEGDEMQPFLGVLSQPPAKFKLKANKSPREIDLIGFGQAKNDKGEVIPNPHLVRGIYCLATDQLTICVQADNDSERPKEFKYEKGKSMQFHLERQKEKKK